MHWKAGAEIPFSQEWIKGFPLRDSNEIQELFQKDSGLLHKASPGLKASQRMPWLLQTVQWPLRAAELHTCFCSKRPRAFAMSCPRIHLLFTWNTVQTPHISLHSWITEALSASPSQGFCITFSNVDGKLQRSPNSLTIASLLVGFEYHCVLLLQTPIPPKVLSGEQNQQHCRGVPKPAASLEVLFRIRLTPLTHQH